MPSGEYQYKVSLNPADSEKLESLSRKLGVNKKEVLEKALKLIELYAQQDESSQVSITVEKENGEKNNYILL